jgi:ribosomal protein S18 acetylase RimI-like enzyme
VAALRVVEPILRSAGPEDAERIAAVHVRSWRAAYRGFVPDDFLARLSVADRAAAWREQLVDEASGQRTIVAQSGDALVGFAAVGPTRDPFASPGTGEVYAVYVDPDEWRRGIGSSLLTQAVEDLRSRGYTSATLWVLAANDIGRRFYERNGWQMEGARQTYPIGEVELEEIRYRIEL